QNRGGAVDVLVRGARVVGLGPTPYLVDVAINYGDGVAQTGPRVNEVGDLAAVVALDTIDATGLFLHPAPAMLTVEDGRRWLRIGNPAAFVLSPSETDARAAGHVRFPRQ
ncbi:MAG TPA: hypothetical protein VFM71_08080, partial [Gemmatimonadaceae bacterium]|nr:hypothetical protein [Gemmatimonadaceae bacterium]